MILYNEKQLECIKHPPAPLMIIAGAGTGKTTTIIGRIAYFIEEREIPPESILALTYTVKAADYLSDSIQNIVGKKSSRINSSNFHSFAFDQVIKYYKAIGYEGPPSIIEPNESKYIIKQLINDNLDSFKSSDYKKDNKVAFENIPKMFDRFRDELILDDFLIEKRDNLLKIKNKDEFSNQLIDCINLFFIYQKYKKENLWIDFGDMIINLWKLLNQDSVLSEIQSVIKHIIVDEYQDNNYALSQIVKKICGNQSSITIVGDDDQSIYSFRGANVVGFQEFRDYFGSHDNYSEVILDVNYRSTQSILNFSDEIVKNNSLRFKNDPLISNKDINSDVVLFSGDKDMQHAKILEISHKHIEEGKKPSDLCILTRNGSNAIEISNYLNSFNIKNSYISGKLFESNTVKDFVSFLNILFNDKYSEIGLYRLVSRSKHKDLLASQGMFKEIKQIRKEGTLKKNSQYNNDFFRHLYLDEPSREPEKLLKSFIIFSNKFLIDQYDHSSMALVNKIIEKYSLICKNKTVGDICEYLNTMLAVNDIYIESRESNDDAISVMTVHQSKGMEFECVIIPFLSSGSFPSRNYKSQYLDDLPKEWLRGSQALEIEKIEEERRIFHVASTRAKNKLYLLAPEKGKSKFFKEISHKTYLNEALTEYNYPPNKTYQFNFKYSDKIEIPFSATNLSLYESCPLSFKYSKIDKIRSKEKSPAASLGMFVHKVLELIYESKHTKISEIKDILNDIWDHNNFENIYQSKEYIKEAENIIFEYISKNPINPKVRYLLEENLSITANSNLFIGKIDRIDFLPSGEIAIVDYKTSKKKKTPAAIKKDIQLAYYSYLLSIYDNDKFNSNIPTLSSLEFVRDAEDPTVSVSFSQEDIISIKERIKGIVKSVLNNEFTPKKSGHCYFCEYKRLLCPLYK